MEIRDNGMALLKISLISQFWQSLTNPLVQRKKQRIRRNFDSQSIGLVGV